MIMYIVGTQIIQSVGDATLRRHYAVGEQMVLAFDNISYVSCEFYFIYLHLHYHLSHKRHMNNNTGMAGGTYSIT